MDLGVLEINTANEITSFREKPGFDFMVSMGVYAFHKSILELIPRRQFFGFDMLVQKMLSNQIGIRAYRFDGVWLDIGKLEDYNKMVEDFHVNPSTFLPQGA
jgi:NDP-sugar pyrophosphorylase family protein